jgi:predicted permease
MKWRRRLLGRGRRDRDLAEEIQAHIEMATREQIARGKLPDEARAAAVREFGNVALVQQTTREMSPWTAFEQLVQDVRFGARILWHAPGLSATAIILIALVIGGNTTIYSMVNSLQVSPAPGVTAERLVVIKHFDAGVTLSDPFVSFPNYEDYARLTRTVSGLVGWTDERVTLSTEAGNYAVFGALVTPHYFDTLGIGIAHGRGLQELDDQSRDGLVVVISHRLWRDRFDEAPDVLGRAAVINGTPATIVGVAAPGFLGTLRTPDEDLWLPIRSYYRSVNNLNVLSNRGQPRVLMAGQLAPTASITEARAEFAALLAQLHAAFPESFTTYAAQGGLIPLKDPRAKVSQYSANALLPFADIAPRMLAIFSIVTLLTLLVVSANVANLMLGRAVQRQRDTAVRQSLGAPRRRIVRLLVTEGATLAVTAWGAGCLIAWWTTRVILRIIEPRPGLLADARPDWTFAAYAMVLALLATVAFSIAPGLRAWRQPVLPLLKSGEQGRSRERSRLASGLVVLQFALSVLLITSAGLAYRSVSMLNSGDVGFATDQLLLVTVRSARPFASAEPTAAERDAGFALLERVRERLAQTGRVEAVSYARRIPGEYFVASTPIWREGETAAGQALIRAVGPDYLRVLGLAPVAGRELTAEDRRGSRRTAVINQRLAHELFGDASPLGQTLLVGTERGPVEIVGIAPNARFDGPVNDRQPRYLFIAEQQLPGTAPTDPTFFIRYRGTVEAVAPLVGKAIAEVDASLPVVSMTTMNTRLEEITVMENLVMQLLASFAVVSLVIAALGQYAVAMFSIRRRTRDFGVRLALGASSWQIQRSVIGEAFSLTLPGLLIGFALSAATAATFRAALFGVTPVDPATYGTVFLLLAGVSVFASYVPAWRAGRVNVIEALRHE